MDRAISRQGTPISLQSMFVSPSAHCDPPLVPDEGAMVPIHDHLATISNSSLQRVKLTRRCFRSGGRTIFCQNVPAFGQFVA